MSGRALRFIAGKYSGLKLPIPQGSELVIGRSSEADLVLLEDTISRKHSKLSCRGAQVIVSDLGSTNGTYVNGKRIEKALVDCDDRVAVGTCIFKVILSTTEGEPTGVANAAAMRTEIRRALQKADEQVEESGSLMSGTLADVPVAELLQLFAVNRKSGVLRIDGPKSGRVLLREGNTLFAEISGYDGMAPLKAFCRMVTWDEGLFFFEPLPANCSFEQPLNEKTEGLLLEALRQSDEMAMLLQTMPELKTSLRLRLPLGPRLSMLDSKQLDVLQHCLNLPNMLEVLDVTAQTDHETLVEIKKLLTAGYLDRRSA